MSRTEHTDPIGLTLLEMIIVIPIIAIISIVLMNLIVNSTRSYRYSQLQAQTSFQLANYLDRMSRVIRSSSDVDTALANTLIVYSYFSPRDTVPDKVRYFLSGNSLKVGVIQATGTAPNYTYNADSETVTPLLDHVVNGSIPTLTYYDDTGAQLTGTVSPSAVKEIGIYLGLNPDAKVLKSPLISQIKVNLRNKKTNL